MKRLFLLTLGLMVALPYWSLAQVQAAPLTTIPPQLTSCLKEKIGAEVFSQITDGTHTPTAAEAALGETCFQQYGKPSGEAPKTSTKHDMPPTFSSETDACMKKTLGSDYQAKISDAKSETEGQALRKKAESCFASGGSGSHENSQGKMPDAVKACIVKTVGQDQLDVMLKGEPPESDTDVYKKLDASGCFSQFKHGEEVGGKKPDLPPDKKTCIEGVMGSVNSNPTPEQRDQVAKKCFAGGKEGEQSADHPQVPQAVQACLKASVGDDYQSIKTESLTSEQKQKAGTCFGQAGFKPGGQNPSEKAPQMSEDTRACIQKISGKQIDQHDSFNDDQKNTINTQCFGGKAPGASAPHDPSLKKTDDPNRGVGATSQAESDAKKACTEKVIAEHTQKMADGEMEALINQTCYPERNYGKTKVDDGSERLRGTTPQSGDGTGHDGVPESDKGSNIPHSGQQQGQKPDITVDDGGAFCKEHADQCQKH